MNTNQIDVEIARLSKLKQKAAAIRWNREVMPRLRKLVGSAVVYRRNCYSCPKDESDYWDVFMLLKEIVEFDGYAVGVYESIQIDSRGCASATIYTRNLSDSAFGLEQCYDKCSLKEYWRKHAAVTRQLNNPSKAIAIAKVESR